MSPPASVRYVSPAGASGALRAGENESGPNRRGKEDRMARGGEGEKTRFVPLEKKKHLEGALLLFMEKPDAA